MERIVDEWGYTYINDLTKIGHMLSMKCIGGGGRRERNARKRDQTRTEGSEPNNSKHYQICTQKK